VGGGVYSVGLNEVVEAGNAERGVVDAVALEAAVARYLPGLHSGEDVLGAAPDLFVGALVLALPVPRFTAGGAAVQDDQPGAREPPSAIVVVFPTAALAPDSAEGSA
jgi:hypothetical protein